MLGNVVVFRPLPQIKAECLSPSHPRAKERARQLTAVSSYRDGSAPVHLAMRGSLSTPEEGSSFRNVKTKDEG